MGDSVTLEAMILIIAGVLVVAVVLLFTHYLALKIGWNMGTKGDPTVIMPKQSKEQPEFKDPYDEEMLDFD